MTQFTCPRCGAPLEAAAGTHIVICPNCQTPTYIDRREAVFFYKIPLSVHETEAKRIFRRWSAGPSMDKNLEAEAKITRFEAKYFPVFSFVRKTGGKEEYSVFPAKNTTLPGMHSLKIPPGNLDTYTGGALDAPILEPDISLESCISQLSGDAVSQSIVYFPIYDVTYTFRGESYSAVIDAASGDVHPGRYPERSSGSFAGALAAAVVLGFAGGILGVLVNPVFFLLCIAGAAAGKLLGTAVVHRKTEAAK